MSARTLAARPVARADDAPPTPEPPRPVRTGAVRVLAACAVLLAAYLALSTLDDPRGTLGTDTGGKLATLRSMDRTGDLVPDVGYWAARFDADGALHPLYYTSRVGGAWVNVTTLPMVYAAWPLHDIAGERGVLLVPMLGAVLCALAARRLSRLLHGGGGWLAFWVIGLATPVAVYALDFWEHTLGLACMLFGVGVLVEVGRGDARARAAILAGGLFGFAATMRTEALVYLVVATLVVLWQRLRARERIARVVATGAMIAGGALLPLALNQVMEQLVFGMTLRSGRATGTAGAAASRISGRVGEAFTTTFGVNGFRPPIDVVVGIVVVALVGAGVFALGFARQPGAVLGAAATASAGVVLVARLSEGLGFVPGLLVASPLAVVGLLFGWRERRARVAVIVACAALPVVWLFQYQGGARPQWGGRYVLLSGALLAVVAVGVLRNRRAALVATLALSVAVTACGVAWLSQRSHAVADGMEALVARDDQAVVSMVGHLFREGGAFYDADRHWLTATTGRELRRAVGIVGAAGDTEVAVVAPVGRRLPEEVGGFVRVADDRLGIRPREPLRVVTYRDSASP